MDICLFLDTLQDLSVDIWNLAFKEKRELVYYLEKPCITVSDWRMLADELGFTNSEISKIKSIRRGFEKPAVLLFNTLISKYPTITLQELILACSTANRPDILEKLKIITQRILSEKC